VQDVLLQHQPESDPEAKNGQIRMTYSSLEVVELEDACQGQLSKPHFEELSLL
jgi:hypothetical protein